MSTHRANFDAWYKEVLDLLYPRRDAGFAILLVAFPLLERYLRQKTGLTSDQNLSDAFFDGEELLADLPQWLASRDHFVSPGTQRDSDADWMGQP